jgi:hypothetical protein
MNIYFHRFRLSDELQICNPHVMFLCASVFYTSVNDTEQAKARSNGAHVSQRAVSINLSIAVPGHIQPPGSFKEISHENRT